ncbi:EMC1 family protein [Megaselia abdita]
MSKSVVLCLASILFLNSTLGLYEDQIKKFDWKLTQIGKVNNAFLDLNPYQQNRLIVSTEENVIASLDPLSGNVQWRQILENQPRGQLKLIQMLVDDSAPKTAVRHQSSKSPYDILTVQGHSPAIVRGWNAFTGNLEFEWSLVPLQTETAEDSFWFHGNDMNLYHVIPNFGSHLEVTEYIANNGNSKGTTSKISASWIQKDKCLISGSYYICLEGSHLLALDLTATSPQILKKVVPSSPKTSLKAVRGVSGAVSLDGFIYSFDEKEKLCGDKVSGQSLLKAFQGDESLLVEADLKNNVLEISVKSVESCETWQNVKSTVQYPSHNGVPEVLAFSCRTNRQNTKVCSFVLTTEDEALLYVQGDKIRWAREEALANVVSGEFIDLPLSDSDGSIEDELKSKPGDLFGAFSRRVVSQIHLVRSIFLHVLGLGPAPTATQKAGLIRDAFGLHKMLVVLTQTGKVYGLDNINGKIHWSNYLRSVENFNNGEEMKLIVQRTSKHFPKQPICTIITKSAETKKGVLFSFNPITGAQIGETNNLNYEIQQIAFLPEDTTEFLKAIVLFDHNNQVHVIPENYKKQADGLYLFTANKKSAILNGFHLKFNEKSGQLQPQPIWTVNLSGHGSTQEITSIAAKNPIEHVHSQGRVLNDRSVLYKYINPNLVAVVTQGLDNIHKFVMNVHLVDVVSGSVVFSLTHRKVRGPIKIVHSENWLAYSYFNDKVRRSEITAIELYEGKVQANSSVWSSLDAPPMPLVERQSYILPFSVEFLKETITERGITNKHVLIATSAGNIMEMPWFYLDPRRPIIQPNQPREEGVLPYIPELPFIQENMINYNQTIARIQSIFTAPSGLESTCLVLATGLDLFVTRVSPSKTFDLLKEDFDYYLIAMVLVALTSASLFVKQLSARKILKQAWK